MGMGGLAGGFLSGWVANALGVRRAMLLCFGGCFTLALLLFQGHARFTALTMANIATLALMFGISQGLLSVYIPLLFPVPIRATATGFPVAGHGSNATIPSRLASTPTAAQVGKAHTLSRGGFGGTASKIATSAPSASHGHSFGG